MNYMGGKYSSLKYILPCFPNKIDKFVDLFAGGFNVGVNVKADTIYANDQLTPLIELYSYIQQTPAIELLREIEAVIDKYDLSLCNTVGYNMLRTDYNKAPSPLYLFVLTCFSFNHQIRFNNSRQFNTPFGTGRSTYNDSIASNLVLFCRELQKKNIVFSSKDFRDFDFTILSSGDVVYCDPPYLLSNGSYNDGKRGFRNWTKYEDNDLLNLLDKLDKNQVTFVLSNVFAHKGQVNENLINWSQKYSVSYINKSYSNCNYHMLDRTKKTIEVLITNKKGAV